MASVMRPAIFRQAYSLVSASRTYSTTSIASTTSRTSVLLRTKSAQSAFAPSICSRVAAFHASSRRALLPALPQKVKGTLNDPAPVPPTSPTHGSYHWSFERVVAAGLIPLSVAPFATGSLNPITDAILVSLVLIHSHIGFEALVTDYIPTWRMPRIRKLFDWGTKLATLVVAIGFYEFETNDVGVTEAIKRIWTA